jgi:superfamily II DNA or RNA helicase
MELREHQAAALEAIAAAAAAGERRMSVVSACGTGKTLVAVEAAQALAKCPCPVIMVGGRGCELG